MILSRSYSVFVYTYRSPIIISYSVLSISYHEYITNYPYTLCINTLQPMVLVYLPTWLGDFVRANVGVHIPAPWFAYGIALAVRYSHWFCSLKHHGCPCIAGWDPHESAFKRPLASRYRSSHPQLRPRAGGLAVPSEPWPPALGRTTYGRAFDPCQPQPAEMVPQSCACRSLFWLTTSTDRDHDLRQLSAKGSREIPRSVNSLQGALWQTFFPQTICWTMTLPMFVHSPLATTYDGPTQAGG